jgi:hypothetical protein
MTSFADTELQRGAELAGYRIEGRSLATLDFAGTIRVWDACTGARTRRRSWPSLSLASPAS